jgi:hypothetical protein
LLDRVARTLSSRLPAPAPLISASQTTGASSGARTRAVVDNETLPEIGIVLTHPA